MKLSKLQTRLHDEAMGLVDAGRALTLGEQEFILENYHPGAVSNIGKAGAFFTPPGMANVVAQYHGGSGKVLDACAGIGMLGWHLQRLQNNVQLICVELNPDYVKVGKALLPDAEWIVGDVREVLKGRKFDSGLSNPPFGRIAGLSIPGYEAHFVVLSLLTKCCAEGAVVIVPDNCHSMADRQGRITIKGKGVKKVITNIPGEQPNDAYRKFVHEHPGWDIVPGPYDMRCFAKDWKGADPKVMICNLEHT